VPSSGAHDGPLARERELPTTDSPAAARRRLRLALRSARELAQLTQADVAERLEWSISKVNRIENGEVTISATDLRALMALLGVTDAETVELFTSWARTARSRGWWDGPQFRAHLTPALRQLIQYEAEATAIRCFHPTLIPGMLQTPEYARTVLDFWVELPEETRAARQALRLERRSRLLQRQDRPQFLLLLDESAIQRPVGGPAVMAEQLSSLLFAIRSGEIIARVVPLISGAHLGAMGSFTILDLSDDENAILYREIALDDDNVRDGDVVGQFRRAFEHMWAVALPPEKSAVLIESQATIMNTLISSPRSAG
jgi:transcriptional regulator with XRE-family HTH domain